MSVDLDRQLLEYCREMDQNQGTLSFQDVLDRTDAVPVIPGRVILKPQPRRRWVAVTIAALAVIAIVVGTRFLPATDGPPEPADQPPTTSAVTPATELLNGFIESRVAGEGAGLYLNGPEGDVPLLYETSSGTRYEGGEFEPVNGVEWPYGLTAFKTRLFSGDTVVEQIVFIDPDTHKLTYRWDGFATQIPPTTENGRPVAWTYSTDNGANLYAAHPWVGFQPDASVLRLIPDDPNVTPTAEGGFRIEWDLLLLMSDPAPVGTDCRTRPSPVDSGTLAESILSDSGIEATDPVAVSTGGAEGFMIDVKIEPGATVCIASDDAGNPLTSVLTPLFDFDQGEVVSDGFIAGVATGDRMRLYLFDVPEGSSLGVLAIAIAAPESSFQRAVETAAPIIDTIELPTG